MFLCVNYCHQPALNCLRRLTISYNRCSSRPLLLHHFLEPPPLSPFTCWTQRWSFMYTKGHLIALNMFISNSQCHIMSPLLTSIQALKVLSRVKGSPWLLCRGWRAVAQSGLCCELRRKGDWTLRAAATVNTGSTRLNTEPSTSIFPEWTQAHTLTHI